MRKRRWLRRAVVALVVLVAASAGLSWLLRLGRVHRYLNGRLEAAFGRPVEVGGFGFSLLTGPRLEAESITVTEDPRFGHEYFLRAERLTASLRWSALARGRFEFGTLSFMHPSLNLVRAEGHWNIESWLPSPSSAATAPLPQPAANLAARLYRIEVDTGRINFKTGADKHPFALVEVKGNLEQEGAGRWRVDLEARPMRAAVVLQEVGTLRLRGRIAGTLARLQPVDLLLTWRDASLADALRLARGYDYGVRGRLVVELAARSEAPPTQGALLSIPWSFAGTARLTNIHGWDLPQRPRDPAVNLTVEAQWRPGEGRVEFSKCLLDAPGSNVRASGVVQWVPSLDPEFRFTSAVISLADVLAWYGAFRPGVRDDLALEGSVATEFTLRGWPPRLEHAMLASGGAQLSTAAFREPIRLGPLAAHWTRGSLGFGPATINLPANPPAPGGPTTPPARAAQARHSNSLRVDGVLELGTGSSAAQGSSGKLELNLVGQTDRVEDLLAAAAALGRPLSRGWSVEGPVGMNLRWQGSLRPFAPQFVGTIELRGVQFRASYLNQPVKFENARIELRPGERHVTLLAAQGLGAHWKGSFWRSSTRPGRGVPWEFDLTADRLDATELDRWLGPRARPGLLQRVLPFVAPPRTSSELDQVLAGLRAHGRLHVDEVLLLPLSARSLSVEPEINGRKIALRKARAAFYGGALRGSLQAELSAQPSYRLEAQFERVNLASLAAATTTLKERFAGVTSGELQVAARGIGRENLLASLEGRGALITRGAEMRGLDLRASYLGGRRVQGVSRFATAEAQFSLAARRIRVERLRLADHEDDFEVAGELDFSRSLDLRLRLLGAKNGVRPRAQNKTVRLTGALDAPEVAPLEPQAGKR